LIFYYAFIGALWFTDRDPGAVGGDKENIKRQGKIGKILPCHFDLLLPPLPADSSLRMTANQIK